VQPVRLGTRIQVTVLWPTVSQPVSRLPDRRPKRPSATSPADSKDGSVESTGSIATTDGRVPGQRGRATRQRLMESTIELLSSTPWRSVKVIDIARRAGTSPATFYQYFENVEEALSVVAEEMVDDAGELADLVAGDWSEASSWDTALVVCEGFLSFWEANRTVFRVVDLATDEGDAKLRGVRVRALNAVTVALARVISVTSPGKTGPVGTTTNSPAGTDPMAVAGTLVAMFASVSAHRYGFEFWGIRTRDLVDSQARMLHWAVTGRPGPEGVVGREPLRPARTNGARTTPIFPSRVVTN
jgi:AcrR family transcriptional regulator